MSTHDLPVFGPTEVFADEDHTPDVVVRVGFALSRAQLLTALSIGFTEIAVDRDPDELTVEETRVEVEGWLAAAAQIELERYMTQGQLTAYPPEAQPVMDALAAAVDRAYRAAPAAAVSTPATVNENGTVTAHTTDAGPVTFPEPAWCRGGHVNGVHRADITHDGPEVAAVADIEPVGEVEFLQAWLSHAPFAELPPEPHPTVAVELDEARQFGPAGLRTLAAELVVHAGRLRGMADRLARLTEGGKPS